MDSIRINDGMKRIAINDDPERVIEFNPNDVLFAERFYAIYREYQGKRDEFDARSKALDLKSPNDMDANAEQSIAFLREICEFMREKIDQMFGTGASQKAFGSTLSMDMIGQFLVGMTPYIQPSRTAKMQKYVNTATGKKRVMK